MKESNLSTTLAALKVPPGTPDESAMGIYEMLDFEEIQIERPRPPEAVKPILVPPPLLMGRIPSAIESKTHQKPLETQSTSSVIVAEPKMRDLQKELVTMIPSSVRRKGQFTDHQSKKPRVSQEDEYEKFMSQFE